MSHGGNDYTLDRIRDELEVDPIKRVLEQCRAQEALFQEEHDGMSSAEYYGESGWFDVRDEAI
jgi:hypothetical protein